jgi:hypothetical protein
MTTFLVSKDAEGCKFRPKSLLMIPILGPVLGIYIDMFPTMDKFMEQGAKYPKKWSSEMFPV